MTYVKKVLFILIILSLIFPIFSINKQDPVSKGDIFLSFFSGRYTDDYLADNVIFLSNINYEDSWIMGATVSKVISEIQTNYYWELEAQLAKHFGVQQHWELNGLFIFRLTNFPWNRLVFTTLGIGEGISHASKIPSIERSSHTNRGAAKTLNYLLIETTFSSNKSSRWQMYLRIHHRSGVFGLFNGVRGGSNIICLGLKKRL